MKRKNTLLCIVLLVTCTILQGQTVGGAGAATAVDSTKTIIHDSSLYRVYYQLSRRTDPEGNKKKEGFTVLQIGKIGYFKSSDYASLRTDSLTRVAARNGDSFGSYFGKAMTLGKQMVHDIDLLYSPEESQFIVQEKVPFSERYQYADDIKDLVWYMVAGDSIVAEQKCKKTVTTFRGRDYIAWYAPEITLPYGPYKFCGLPGLILCIYDTDGDYIFTIAGLQTIDYYDPIFTREKFVKESRENIQKMQANYHADPAFSIRNRPGIYISEEDLAEIEPSPYNPIERQ